ncbi:MAG: nuclear transport factor 2 family protein [Planctomyces sp.]|nr:nuclear transport factor 2 family protein [Planctomyces sp.]
MQKFVHHVFGAAVFTLCSITLQAQEQAASDQSAADQVSADHEALTEFRKKLVAAVIENDVDTQLSLVHPEIVTVWQDNRIVSHPDGLKQFFESMGTNEERGFVGYTQEPTPLAPTRIFDGRFGFAHGTSVARYEIYGLKFELPNTWTATLLKDNDQWKLVGYHVSGNLADNPLLSAAKSGALIAGIAAAAVGLIVGFLLGRRSGRKPAANAS